MTKQHPTHEQPTLDEATNGSVQDDLSGLIEESGKGESSKLLKAELKGKQPKAPKAEKAPKEPKPKPTPKKQDLAHVVQKQETELHIRLILAPAIYVRQRMDAGQTREVAVEQVFALYRKHLEGLLDESAKLGVDVRAALEPYVTRELPHLADRRNWNV